MSAPPRPHSSRPPPPSNRPKAEVLPIIDLPKTAGIRRSKAAGDNAAESDRSFLCKLRFRNDFDSLPADPRLLQYPMDHARLTRYTTALDNQYTFSLHTEPDLGIPINLIIPSVYDVNENNPPELSSKDAYLLEDDDLKSQKNKSEISAHSIPWLRRTTYISADYSNEILGTGAKSTDKDLEMEAGRKRIREEEEEVMGRTLREWCDIVDKEFEEAKKEEISHPLNKKLSVVEVQEVVPDFELWANEYTYFYFDEDPGLASNISTPSIHRGLLQMGADDEDSAHVSYFLPTSDVVDIEGGQSESFKWVRQYVFKKEPNLSQASNAFFLRHSADNKFVFHPIPKNRVHLRRIFSKEKRRLSRPTYSGLNIQFLAPTEEEIEQRQQSLSQLEARD